MLVIGDFLEEEKGERSMQMIALSSQKSLTHSESEAKSRAKSSNLLAMKEIHD